MAFHTGPDMGASKSSRPQSGINSKGVGTIKPGSVSPGTKAGDTKVKRAPLMAAPDSSSMNNKSGYQLGTTHGNHNVAHRFKSTNGSNLGTAGGRHGTEL